ncbi:MAG: ribosome assembly RNA-binding protein YhbY [Oscillospiraceae bacterium]|nr:ribosome assembly RNA-binding protein YhbY [Oscillospiraceae bacterium]
MLTSKNRAQLRAMASKLEPIFQVGKGGVTANMLAQLDDTLEARELIKCRVLETCPAPVEDAATAVAEQLDADVVQVIGRVFVLYRESVKNKVIELED